MNNHWFNIGGGNRSTGSRDPGQKSWRDIMKEKQTSGQPGTYCNGNTNADLVQSQAASNHTNPMSKPESRSNHQDTQEAEFMGPMMQQGEHMQGHADTQELGSISSAMSKQANEQDHAEIEEKHPSPRPKTIFSDLNAVPEVEVDEQLHAHDVCDLTLNLTFPVPQGQPLIEPASGPTPSQTQGIVNEGTTQVVNGVTCIGTHQTTEEGSYPMHALSHRTTELMMGVSSHPTGALEKWTYQMVTIGEP